MLRRALIVGLGVGLSLTSARALETDPYYAWQHEVALADATDVLNAKINSDIDFVLANIAARKSKRRLSCHEVTHRISSHFRDFIFHDIEIWASKSALVPRFPATPEEERIYRQTLLYRDRGPLDLARLVPPSPTIELAGVRIGTDKLSHFFSAGWQYYRWYQNALERGRSPQAAETRAIRRGVFMERTILGELASGVFSLGDLEANHEGLRFLLSCCEGPNPLLAAESDGWRRIRQFDFRDHVGPEWDEMWVPPAFSRGRWKRIRPALLDYCPLLADPAFVGRRQAYRTRDRQTPTELFLASLEADGRSFDFLSFDLEHNCESPTRAARTR